MICEMVMIDFIERDSCVMIEYEIIAHGKQEAFALPTRLQRVNVKCCSYQTIDFKYSLTRGTRKCFRCFVASQSISTVKPLNIHRLQL